MIEKFKHIAFIILSGALIFGLIHDIKHNDHVNDLSESCVCPENFTVHLHQDGLHQQDMICHHEEISYVDFTKKINEQNQNYYTIDIDLIRPVSGSWFYGMSYHNSLLPANSYQNKSALLRAPPYALLG